MINFRRITKTLNTTFHRKPTQQFHQLAGSTHYADSLSFDSHSYASTLQHAIHSRDSDGAMAVHSDIVKRGNCLDLFARNILLNFYAKSGFISEARNVFDEVPNPNTVSFVTLIRALSESGRFEEAIEFLLRMFRGSYELNAFAFTTALSLLVRMGRAELGLTLHCCAFKLGLDSDAFVASALMDAYSVCGRVDMARRVFDAIVARDIVAWTGIIACCADNASFGEALELFHRMRRLGFEPNNFTFASVIKACVGLGCFNVGRSIHACVLKSRYEDHQFVALALLELYMGSENFSDGLKLFEEMPKKDVVPWSFMIARFAQKDRCDEALDLFLRMKRAFVLPNQFTCASVLQACAAVEDLALGNQVHCHTIKAGLDLNVFVSNALMDFYAKCGRIEDSSELFVQSENKNNVTWNTMIVGFVQLGDGESALSLFSSMVRLQVEATEVTYSSAFRACAGLSALEPGLQIHSLAIKNVYDKDVVVGNALIDMYGKCGGIKEARSVFDRLPERDQVSWNAMISGYSMHGLGTEALEVFEIMRRTECTPDKLTFVGVLAACSNAALLERGQGYFNSMTKDYGIKPCIEHYTCMVGLFGRLGYLDKAMKLIEEIPFEPSIMVWRALLGACVVHNDTNLGIFSAQKVLEMDPQDDATHVLLSNLYANVKSWEDVAFVRKSMKKRGVKKEPGRSWIENQGIVHYFAVGDMSHPDMKLIIGVLEWLNVKTWRSGFVSNHDAILRRMEDDEKERHLWLHSERLALAFGLIRTPSGSAIRIIKNLRICIDCHAVMKLISKITKRNILVRDLNRFHNFHDGVCSCSDCW